MSVTVDQFFDALQRDYEDKGFFRTQELVEGTSFESVVREFFFNYFIGEKGTLARYKLSQTEIINNIHKNLFLSMDDGKELFFFEYFIFLVKTQSHFGFDWRMWSELVKRPHRSANFYGKDTAKRIVKVILEEGIEKFVPEDSDDIHLMHKSYLIKFQHDPEMVSVILESILRFPNLIKYTYDIVIPFSLSTPPYERFTPIQMRTYLTNPETYITLINFFKDVGFDPFGWDFVSEAVPIPPSEERPSSATRSPYEKTFIFRPIYRKSLLASSDSIGGISEKEKSYELLYRFGRFETESHPRHYEVLTLLDSLISILDMNDIGNILADYISVLTLFDYSVGWKSGNGTYYDEETGFYIDLIESVVSRMVTLRGMEIPVELLITVYKRLSLQSFPSRYSINISEQLLYTIDGEYGMFDSIMGWGAVYFGDTNPTGDDATFLPLPPLEPSEKVGCFDVTMYMDDEGWLSGSIPDGEPGGRGGDNIVIHTLKFDILGPDFPTNGLDDFSTTTSRKSDLVSESLCFNREELKQILRNSETNMFACADGSNAFSELGMGGRRLAQDGSTIFYPARFSNLRSLGFTKGDGLVKFVDFDWQLRNKMYNEYLLIPGHVLAPSVESSVVTIHSKLRRSLVSRSHCGPFLERPVYVIFPIYRGDPDAISPESDGFVRRTIDVSSGEEIDDGGEGSSMRAEENPANIALMGYILNEEYFDRRAVPTLRNIFSDGVIWTQELKDGLVLALSQAIVNATPQQLNILRPVLMVVLDGVKGQDFDRDRLLISASEKGAGDIAEMIMEYISLEEERERNI